MKKKNVAEPQCTVLDMSNIWGDRCIFPEHSLNKRKNSAGRVAISREIAVEEGMYTVPAESKTEM